MDLTNGVSCIKGETHSLITLMRLNTRWATRSTANKKFLKDSSSSSSSLSQASSSLFYYYDDEDPHIQSFRQLNEYLEGIYNISDVDCLKYITPFHNIIISEQANGSLTSAALSSLSKFALYGFFQPNLPRIREGLNLIVNSISQCVFEESDRESDEIILMKLLELSSLLFRCQASSLLSSENSWDVYSTCLSIYSHVKASKVLKSEAETTLVHITLNLFTRVSTLINSSLSTDLPSTTTIPVLDNSASASGSNFKAYSSTSMLNSTSSSSNLIISSEELSISTLSGITHLALRIIKELSKKLQDKEEIQLGLFLINVALEAGGVALNSIKELIEILRHDVCRFLLRATQSDDLKVFSSSLRVVFNLFMSIKEHMKVQLEVFLTSVHLRLLNNNVGNISAREELALESLLEFCREPLLMQDLYANYDCDFQCTNIFDGIITTLAKRSIVEVGCVPEGPNNNSSLRKVFPHNSSANSKIDRTLLFNNDFKVRLQLQLEKGRYPSRITVLHRLAFDGILAVLKSIVLKFSTIDSMVLSQINEKKILVNKKKLSNILNQNKKLSTNNNESDSEEYEFENYSSYDEFDICNFGTLTSPKDFEMVNEFSSFTPADNSNNDDNVNASILPPLSITPSSSIVLNKIYNSKKINFGTLSSNLSPNTRDSISNIEELRQKRQAKQKLRVVVEAFNQAPLKSKWVSLALDAKLLNKLTEEDLLQNEKELEEKEKEITVNTNSNSSTATLTKEKQYLKLISAAYKQSINSYCSVHPKSFAQFLRDIPGLSREEIGVFISQGPNDRHPLHSVVLNEFLKTFSFNNVPFGTALRMFLSSFRLPGEAQCIDRIMEAFAGRYFEFADTITLGDNLSDQGVESNEPLFASADAVFILAFSTILLNTDLHNPQIPAAKKMSRDDFIKNNRGINDGKNLPREFLINVYEEIKSSQIRVLSDSKAVTDFSDPQMWHKLVPKTTTSLNELPQFTTTFPSVRHRNSFSLPLSLQLNFTNNNNQSLLNTQNDDSSISQSQLDDNETVIEFSELLECEIDMFLVISKGVFETLIVLIENVVDDTMVKRILHGILLYLTICSRLKLNSLFNNSLNVLFYRLNHLFLSSNDFFVQNFASINFSPQYFSSIRGKFEIFANNLIYEQWKKEEGHDLLVLLNTSVTSLFGDFNCSVLNSLFSSKNSPSSSPIPSMNNTSLISGSNSSISTSHSLTHSDSSMMIHQSNATAEFVDWTEASMVKTQLLLSILLKIMTDFHCNVGTQGWTSLLVCLLYARSRGALPSELSKLECYLGGHLVDDKEEIIDDKTDTKGGSNIERKKKSLPKEFLQPTLFSKNSFFSSLNSYFRQGDLTSTIASFTNASASTAPSSTTTSPTRSKSTGSSNNWGLFSIGDFLWSSSSDNFDEETTKVREFAYHLHDMKNAPNSSLSHEDKMFFYDTNFSPLVNSPLTSTTNKSYLRTDDNFLSTVLNNNLSFLSIIKNSSAFFTSIEFDDSFLFTSLLEVLINILSSFQISSPILSEWHKSLESQFTTNSTSNSANSNDNFPNHLLPSQFKFFHQVNELDAVLVLEWLSFHLFPSSITSPISLKKQDMLNQRKEWLIKFLTSTFSPSGQTDPASPSSFSSTIDGEISDSTSKLFLEDVSQKLPFFLERCVVLMFRLSLLELSSASSLGSSATVSIPIPLTLSLLNLLNNLPSTFLLQISSLIGSGLISLVQYFYKLNVRILKNEWQIFFNILLKIINNFEGREKIWQIISIIIMEDLINKENFNEIKKILIQFITYSKINEEINNKKEHEEWALKSLLYLLRLCLIRLASYAYFNSLEFISSCSIDGSSLDDSVNDRKIFGYLTFPDPLEAKKGSISTLVESTPSDPSLNSPNPPIASSSATSWLTVPIISLDSNELSDFSLSLWVTSIVLFSDLCNAPSLRLIHRSLYCLEVSILAARHLETGVLAIKSSTNMIKNRNLENLTFPKDLWYKVMNEVLSRLPLNLTITSQKFSGYTFSLSEIAEISYRSCNIILKVFLDLFSLLKGMNNFNDFYLKLINYSILNASVSIKGQTLHEEMIHMTIALLKILRLPPLNSSILNSSLNLSNISTLSNQKNTTTNSSTSSKSISKNESKSSYFSVLSWINPFSNPSPPTSSTSVPNSSAIQTESSNNSQSSTIKNEMNTANDKEDLISSTPIITPQQYNEFLHHDGHLLVSAWKLITSIYPSSSGIIRNWDPLLHKSILSTVELIESGKLDKIIKMLPPLADKEKEKEKEKEIEKEKEYRENFKENFNKKMMEKNKLLNKTDDKIESNPLNSLSPNLPSVSSPSHLIKSSPSPSIPFHSASPSLSLTTESQIPPSNFVSPPKSPSSSTSFLNSISSPPLSPPSTSSVPVLVSPMTTHSEKPSLIPSLAFPSSISNQESLSPFSNPTNSLFSSPISSSNEFLSPAVSSSIYTSDSSLPLPTHSSTSASLTTPGQLSTVSISVPASVSTSTSASTSVSASVSASSSTSDSSSVSASTSASTSVSASGSGSASSTTPTSDRPKVSSTNLIMKAKYFDASSPIQIV